MTQRYVTHVPFKLRQNELFIRRTWFHIFIDHTGNGVDIDSVVHIKCVRLCWLADDEMIDRVPSTGVIHAQQETLLWGRKRVFDNDDDSGGDICKTVSDVQIKSNLSECKYVIHGPLSGKQHVSLNVEPHCQRRHVQMVLCCCAEDDDGVF